MDTLRDHHCVPQFYLRNFATDAQKKKIATVAKKWYARDLGRTFNREPGI